MLLIHFGAQLDIRDEAGLTPMHMAAGYANAQTLRVLVAAGADTNLKGDVQGTPFEIVCALGDYQLTQVAGNRFKKKDDKLEKLKSCMDVLDDPEAAREEADWDAMLTEVLKAISPNLTVEANE
jgi:ankyrin repeat protein